jgi:glycosyltransferase involved in cell wall biosynthesis
VWRQDEQRETGVTLWMDVSLSHGTKATHGIARVELELAKRFAKRGDVRFMIYQPIGFVEVQYLAGDFVPVGQTSDVPEPSEPTTTETPIDSTDLGPMGSGTTLSPQAALLVHRVEELQREPKSNRLRRLSALTASLGPNKNGYRSIIGRTYDRLRRVKSKFSRGGGSAAGSGAASVEAPQAQPEQVPVVLDSVVMHHEATSDVLAPQDLPRPEMIPWKAGDTVLVITIDEKVVPLLARLKDEMNFTWINCFHDLVPIDFPQYVQPANATLDRLLLVFSAIARKSDGVFCVSRYTRERLTIFCEGLGVGWLPMRVIYHSGDFMDSSDSARTPAGAQLAGVPDAPYILTVGTFEVRKNYTTLVNAVRVMMEQSDGGQLPYLVIAGGEGWLSGDIQHLIESDAQLRERVVRVKSPSDQELEWLYRNAAGFAYASPVEGFGLPILEAQRYGLPCAISDIPVFRELFPGERFVSPFDTGAWAKALRELPGETRPSPGALVNRTWDDVARDVSEFVESVTAEIAISS